KCALKLTEGALLAAYAVYSIMWIYIWTVRLSIIQIHLSFSLLYYVFMSLFAGMGAFPLYRIAEGRLGNIAALSISLSYLLYFPLAGANWSGTDTAFTTLLLLAYYFYDRKKAAYSSIAYALGSVLGPLPSLFSFIIISSTYVSSRRKVYYIPLAVSSVSLSAYAVLRQFPSLTLNSGLFYAGFFALFIMLLPLLFAPLASYWALALIPLAVLAFSSSGYQYPQAIFSGAVMPFIPFIFLGLINGASRIARGNNKSLKVFSVILLINAASFAAVYQPVSPLNQYSTLDYGFVQLMSSYNQAKELYGNMSGMLELLPAGSSVLVQENILPPGNIRAYAMAQVSSDQLSSFKYVLVGPNSSYFGPMSAAEKLYSNYGILAEADDMVLLGKNYTGPISYYRPTSVTWQAASIIPLSKTFLDDGVLSTSDAKGMQAWYIPYNFLPPGNYTITLYVKQSSPSPSNQLSVAIFADNLTRLLSLRYISNSMVNESWTRIEYSFTVQALNSNIEISSYINSWQGSIYISNITVMQSKG
ncbi:MAG: hypothetical protein ACP5T3_03620, partial [Candidatus Micrarchaeia archaeon]